MEIKKSKEADLEKKKPGIFLFSLVIAAGFMLMAFEWASNEVGYSIDLSDYGELIEEEPVEKELVIIRPRTNIPPKAKPPIKKNYVKTKVDDTTKFIVLDTTPSIVTNTTTYIDTLPLVVGEPTKPPLEQITDFAEEMPEYIGGIEAMYEKLNNSLKPNHIGLGGKVYVEFVVEKDGTVSNVKIKKGVNKFLDQNALQAVKKLNNWKPGIQNHHEVRVRMVLPINFKVR